MSDQVRNDRDVARYWVFTEGSNLPGGHPELDPGPCFAIAATSRRVQVYKLTAQQSNKTLTGGVNGFTHLDAGSRPA